MYKPSLKYMNFYVRTCYNITVMKPYRFSVAEQLLEINCSEVRDWVFILKLPTMLSVGWYLTFPSKTKFKNYRNPIFSCFQHRPLCLTHGYLLNKLTRNKRFSVSVVESCCCGILMKPLMSCISCVKGPFVFEQLKRFTYQAIIEYRHLRSQLCPEKRAWLWHSPQTSSLETVRSD